MLMLIVLLGCETDRSVEPDFKNYFVKYYGAGGNQQGVDLVVNADGTMLLLGNSRQGDIQRFFVTKIDSTGEILSSRFYGEAVSSAFPEVAVDIEPTFDGNYVVAVQKTIGPGDRDAKLLKISPDLNVLDSVVYTYPGDEELVSVTPLQLSGDGFLLTGSTTSILVSNPPDPSNLTDPFNFRLDANLDYLGPIESLWDVGGENGNNDKGIKIIEQGVNNFTMFMQANPQGDLHFFKAPIDASGNIGGTGSFVQISETGQSYQLSHARVNSGNGSVLLTGSTASGQVYFVVLNSQLQTSPDQHINRGNQRLNLSLAGKINGISSAPTKSGDYLLLANEEFLIGTQTRSRLVLVRLNFLGQILNSQVFGAEGTYEGAGVAELPNGKIVIIGTGTLGNQQKMMLIKVNSVGQFLN